MTEKQIADFVIERGRVYNSEQVIRHYTIGRDTLESWIDQGLRFGRRNTRTRYFLGDHLIAFMFGETGEDNTDSRDEQPKTVAPRMLPAGIYSEQDLVRNLRISPAKFREWRRLKTNPLKPLGTGTNANLYSAAVVTAFLEGLDQ